MIYLHRIIFCLETLMKKTTPNQPQHEALQPQETAQQPTLFEKTKHWGTKKVAMALLGAGTLAGCSSPGGGGEEIDTPPTTVTNVVKVGTNGFTINNVTKDADGDATNTTINITKDGQAFGNTIQFDDNNFSQTFNNLDGGTYVVTTLATANGKEATDIDSVDIDSPPTLQINLTVEKSSIDENENMKDIVFATLENVNGIAGITQVITQGAEYFACLLYTSPSPRD